MSKISESTKDILLRNGGQLFAEHGYDGVSTRMITDQARVKLSSIHYHFGSKENLYIEAFTYAKRQSISVRFPDIIAENPDLINSPEGQAEIIRNTVFRRFHSYFRPDRPLWETRILIREIISPSSALPILSEKLFKPEVEAAESFFRLVKPDCSDHEAAAWADMLHSPILLYSMAREPLKLIRGENALNPEFLREAARTLSRAMILLLNLPLPIDLK